MAIGKKILVSLSLPLIAHFEQVSKQSGLSRSYLINLACAAYVGSADNPGAIETPKPLAEKLEPTPKGVNKEEIPAGLCEHGSAIGNCRYGCR